MSFEPYSIALREPFKFLRKKAVAQPFNFARPLLLRVFRHCFSASVAVFLLSRSLRLLKLLALPIPRFTASTSVKFFVFVSKFLLLFGWIILAVCAASTHSRFERNISSSSLAPQKNALVSSWITSWEKKNW